MIEYRIENPSEWVVWFDLDDTLWDFHNNSFDTLSEVYEEFSLFRFWPNHDSWKYDYHRHNDPLWELLAKGEITQSDLRFKRFYDTFVEGGMEHDEAYMTALPADTFYLENLARKKRLVKGAKELLLKLRKRGFRIGILSNGFKIAQFNKLKSGEIDGLIDIVILSEDIDTPKPNPELFAYAANSAGVLPERCIMIGDSADNDIAGAINAGWPLAVWYNPDGRITTTGLACSVRPECCLAVVNSLTSVCL